MCIRVPIYALNQTDRITLPQRGWLSRLSEFRVLIPFGKSEKYLNVNNKTTASYPTIRLPGLSNVVNHYKTHNRSRISPSLIYEHRHCCITFEIQRKHYRNLYVKKAYDSCNLRKWKDFNKKQFPLLKMCVTSLLCGPRADLHYGHKTAINRPVDHTGET